MLFVLTAAFGVFGSTNPVEVFLVVILANRGDPARVAVIGGRGDKSCI